MLKNFLSKLIFDNSLWWCVCVCVWECSWVCDYVMCVGAVWPKTVIRVAEHQCAPCTLLLLSHWDMCMMGIPQQGHILTHQSHIMTWSSSLVRGYTFFTHLLPCIVLLFLSLEICLRFYPNIYGILLDLTKKRTQKYWHPPVAQISRYIK